MEGIVKKIQARIDAAAARVLKGDLSLEDYRHWCGVIRGLKEALGDVTEAYREEQDGDE